MLAAAWPPRQWADLTVLAAVSGGADSVAMLRALVAVKPPGDGRLVVGHLNHRLREDADADERFVAELSGRLGLECCCGRLEPASLTEAGRGLEAAAREARYRFLRTTAERLGARYVACGHTADDQIETVLHRILRGTGIAGLAGMPAARLSEAVTLVRPLLGARRSELLEYLDRIGQPYRQDRSNLDRRFTRNRLRHDLLPHLAEHYNPAVGDALLRLARLAGEIQEVAARRVGSSSAAVAEGRGVILLRERWRESRNTSRELIKAVWRGKDGRSRRWGSASGTSWCGCCSAGKPLPVSGGETHAAGRRAGRGRRRRPEAGAARPRPVSRPTATRRLAGDRMRRWWAAAAAGAILTLPGMASRIGNSGLGGRWSALDHPTGDSISFRPPRWGWPRFARLVTQGCGLSLAVLHPGLA